MSWPARGNRSRPHGLAVWIDGLPFIVSGLYAAVSALWIVFSDRLLVGLVGDFEHYRALQTWKGAIFVIVSALLIYVLLVYAVARIRAGYASVRRGEERLRVALRCAGGGVWEMPLDGGVPSFAYVSPELLTRLGLDPDRPPRRDEWNARVHPDDLAHAQALMRALAAGTHEDAFETLTRFTGAGGATVWLEAHARIAPTEPGEPRRVTGVSFDVTRRVAAEERVGELLRYDAATGLAKPAKFAADVDARLATLVDGRVVGLFQIRASGLDPAAVADGDDGGALLALADRLKPIRNLDFLAARLSTDVFALATPPLADLRAVHDQVAIILDHLAIADPDVAFAIGAAVFPDDGRTAQALLSASAHALEALGPGIDTRILWFTQGLDEQYRRHAALMRDLRRAVDAGEIVCHYQPLVDLTTGRTAGFEALARWRRADGALVPPNAFISLAERTGDIRAIGEDVLRQACAAAAGWTAGDGPAPFVAVNVSPVQLADPRFPGQVARILALTGLAPERLELEVTESVFAGHLDVAARRLTALRALGVAIAIDDFGTGYSSLSLLNRLPFTRLKIDRCFVADPAGGVAVLETIVTLARRLGLATTAEGIETPDQLARVVAFGVEAGQGYHFSRPVPASDAAALAGRVWRLRSEAEAGVA